MLQRQQGPRERGGGIQGGSEGARKGARERGRKGGRGGGGSERGSEGGSEGARERAGERAREGGRLRVSRGLDVASRPKASESLRVTPSHSKSNRVRMPANQQSSRPCLRGRRRAAEHRAAAPRKAAAAELRDCAHRRGQLSRPTGGVNAVCA